MFVISFLSAYIKNRLLTYCATHIWTTTLLLLLVWFQISRLVPVTHSAVRWDLTKNTDMIICAPISVDECTARIFYHPPPILFVSNTIGQSVQEKIAHSTIIRHKIWLMLPIWTFWIAILFKRNCKVDHRKGKNCF